MGLLLRGKSYNEVIHQLQARLSQLGTHLNCGLGNEWSASGWTSLNSGTTSIHVSCLEWNRQGRPFCTHAYVLETDPVTRRVSWKRRLWLSQKGILYLCNLPILTKHFSIFFKRIAMCTREEIPAQHWALSKGSQISRKVINNVCVEGWQEAIGERCRIFNSNFLKWHSFKRLHSWVQNT